MMVENRLPKMSLDDLLAYQGEEEERERRRPAWRRQRLLRWLR